MRVRNSPFGGGAGSQPAPAATSFQKDADDFFGDWDIDTPAQQTPAQQAPAPTQRPGVTAPPVQGYGIKPPGMVPPPSQGYGIQPPGVAAPSTQGYGIQPPMGNQAQWQQQQQQPQGFDQAQWQQQQQFDQAGPQGQQQWQQQNIPQFQQQMSSFATNMAVSALAGGGIGGMDSNTQQMLLNQGGSIARDVIRGSGFASWFPNTFKDVSMQFNVSHSFVRKKLVLLLCPFPNKESGSPEPQYDQMQSFKVDVNEPDLYIPLMSYFTYCLVYCVQRGILSEFKPEVLGTTFSYAFFLYLAEVLAAKTGFFMVGSPVPVLQLMGNCGYKFVHVLIMVVIRIASESIYIYYPLFFYLAACSSFAVYRFMIRFVPNPQQQQYGQYNQYGAPPPAPGMLHKNIVIALAISQILLCWLMTPSASSKTIAPVAAAVPGASIAAAD